MQITCFSDNVKISILFLSQPLDQLWVVSRTISNIFIVLLIILWSCDNRLVKAHRLLIVHRMILTIAVVAIDKWGQMVNASLFNTSFDVLLR